MNRQILKDSIKAFDFKRLFNELGWDNHSQELDIQLNDSTYKLRAVAIKKEFVVFVCPPDSDGREPDYQIRKKIDSKVTPFAFEHIIIFYDEKKSVQIWQWVKRESGKPTATRETKYYIHQDPEILVQKLNNIEISIDEDESLGISDIRLRTKKAFDVDKVTKQFYDKFKVQHKNFISFIEGIESQVDKEWYTSLMLNRLMFIYFIQKKNFLDNDTNYLSNKLNHVKKLKGKDNFFSFYRSFLLVLFHKGLGSPERNTELTELIGKVPYLNGGLFDIHQLEEKYPDIQIPDKAFENLFSFFDQYEWHLDTRIKATGREINPDVLGYIFEKYINDRASMGAYYTKEDITDYISKNCIIPFLFDETIRNYKENAFEEAFEMLRENPDRYIYPAVRHGIKSSYVSGKRADLNSPFERGKGGVFLSDEELFADLPDEIKAGFRPDLENKIVDGKGEYLCDIRKPWNKPAPPEIALPTEIYREVIERRKRYREIREKINSGEISSINDFITYNLDIRQFAQDMIDNTVDPDLIKHFYQAVKKVSILDPTCGSGAFLFAALNILEPLYESCLQRMKNFIDDAEITTKSGEKKKIKFDFFENELNLINQPQHPNQTYYIYKTIILNNLHGVDIMNEAVEIAKLRLFLKLVSTVEADYSKPNLGLEPLPDIDFNIKTGNTLVGYVSIDELQKSMETGRLEFDEEFKRRILKLCGELGIEMNRFNKAQEDNDDSENLKPLKKSIEDKRKKLSLLSDLAMAQFVYGIDRKDEKRFENWKSTHKPFHWYYEFFEIVSQRGGFDVIIGNPPYVEYSKVRNEYTIKGYKTESCGNLYAFTIEKSHNILNKKSKFGMIVQAPILCTKRMKLVQDLILKNKNFIISFDDRPLKLFEGISHARMSIILIDKFESRNFSNVTKYIKIDDLKTVFQNSIIFEKFENNLDLRIFDYIVFKYSSKIHKNILKKLNNSMYNLNSLTGSDKIYFYNAPGNYIRCQKFSSKNLLFIYINKNFKHFIHCLLNSSLFYIWCSTLFFGRTGFSLNKDEIKNFIINKIPLSTIYIDLSDRIDAIYKSLLKIKNEYQPLKRFLEQSKHIIDEIDKVLAEHYGFTHEELDFIINYDIKYRMGKEAEEEE